MSTLCRRLLTLVILNESFLAGRSLFQTVHVKGPLQLQVEGVRRLLYAGHGGAPNQHVTNTHPRLLGWVLVKFVLGNKDGLRATKQPVKRVMRFILPRLITYSESILVINSFITNLYSTSAVYVFYMLIMFNIDTLHNLIGQ